MTFLSLKQFFTAPVFPDEEQTRSAGLLSFLINLHILVGISTAILLVMFTDTRLIFPFAALISVLPGLGLRVLVHSGHVNLASVLFIGMIFLVMPALAWFSHGAVGTVMVTAFQTIAIVMAGLLLGGRATATFVILTGLVNGALIYAELKFSYVTAIDRDPVEAWVMQMFTFSAIAAMLYITNRLIRASFARARSSEQPYRALLETIPAITYLINTGQEPFNPAIYVSPQVEKIFGHTTEEFIRDPLLWTKLIHPDDVAHVMAESERADLTGTPFISDYRIITRDNQTLWFHDESALIKDEHDRPLYRIGVWTDITARKQAELALQQLEDMYRRAIDAAGAVPYILDESMHAFKYIGAGIQQMTGYSAEEMTSELWNAIVLEGVPRGKLAHLTYAEADHLTNTDHSLLWECDFRIRTRDGQIRWISDTSVKGLDERGEKLIAIGIKQDITERKLVEERIKQLNTELEQRVRERTAQLEAANKELEAFSYSVSHDLRAPLRHINSFTRIIKNDFSEGMDPQARSLLDKVLVSGNKMNQLIDDLLDFSRTSRRPINKRDVDIDLIVRDIVESFAPETAHRQIEWILAELPPAQADPNLMRQVFTNLIGNAVKYTGQRAQARIEIGYRTEETRSIYFVRDNGAGFDMQYADKLFGVFQRLHREEEFEGTGIGLATVQRIIHRHGGRIWAEAEPDKGATFYFTLG
jgi:PAS domain S-box-containing protein